MELILTSHQYWPGAEQKGGQQKGNHFSTQQKTNKHLCDGEVVVSGGGCDGCGVRGKFSGGGGDVVVVMAVIVGVVVVLVAITQGYIWHTAK